MLSSLFILKLLFVRFQTSWFDLLTSYLTYIPFIILLFFLWEIKFLLHSFCWIYYYFQEFSGSNLPAPFSCLSILIITGTFGLKALKSWLEALSGQVWSLSGDRMSSQGWSIWLFSGTLTFSRKHYICLFNRCFLNVCLYVRHSSRCWEFNWIKQIKIPTLVDFLFWQRETVTTGTSKYVQCILGMLHTNKEEG